MSPRAYLRLLFRRQRPLVRPWALAAPILVLFIALPLSRPLRHPFPDAVSDDERARLATIQALAERHTLAIDRTSPYFRDTRQKIARNGHVYSDQPPVMAALLSGPYWVMHRAGLTLDRNPEWTAFLLTLVGVTLPVALAAGLLYRMGRIFELKRPLRAGLALAAVLATGWISYATVLNAQAPAAALVVAAAACLVQAAATLNRAAACGWAALAGLCASVAATYDPPAVIFLFLLLLVIASLRWPTAQRAGGVLLYALGAAGPVFLHGALTSPMTGDLKPGFLHPELQAASPPQDGSGFRLVNSVRETGETNPALLASSGGNAPDEDDEPPTRWRSFLAALGRIVGAFIGRHGLLTHFPVLILGVLGVSMVMHRHWPQTTKILAGATLGGGLAVILAYAIFRTDWRDAMFGARWFVVFLPLTLFWAGAWLRRRHRPSSWTAAAILLCFSVAVSLVGATGPLPREGFDSYTATGALRNLLEPSRTATDRPVLAQR